MHTLSYFLCSLLLTVTSCSDLKNETPALNSQQTQPVEAEGGSLPVFPKLKGENKTNTNTQSPKPLNSTRAIPKIKNNVTLPANETSISSTPLTTNVTRTRKPVPTKPSITEHDDIPNKIVSSKSQAPVQQIPGIDSFEKKNRRADYVIPIVAVILSVPLIAVIISVLYKRGTYWWQHRNYRRMDFLIEGMYNN